MKNMCNYNFHCEIYETMCIDFKFYYYHINTIDMHTADVHWFNLQSNINVSTPSYKLSKLTCNSANFVIMHEIKIHWFEVYRSQMKCEMHGSHKKISKKVVL